MSEENQPEGNQTTDYTGALPDNWRDSLPEDIKASGVLDNINSVEQIAKIAVDTKKMVGSALHVPSEDAADDVKKAFRDDLMTKVPDLMYKPDLESQDSINEVMRSMGMPETVEGYALEGVPEPLQSNFDSLTKTAHEAGLTKAQMDAITKGIVGDYESNVNIAKGQLEEQKGALKQEWGGAYDSKVNTIVTFAKQTGFSEDLINAIETGALPADNMKAFDNVVKGYQGEGVEIGNQLVNQQQVMTPAEADKQLDELMSNKDHAYWHAEDPQHEAAKKKVYELGVLAEAGKEVTEVDRFRTALNGG